MAAPVVPSKPAKALLSSVPRRAAAAPFYPPQDLLDCAGANFSSKWTDFRISLQANLAKGFPKDQALYLQAVTIHAEQDATLFLTSTKWVSVLLRMLPVSRLYDSCLYGIGWAMFVVFRHDPRGELLESIMSAMGWAEWPFDFTESSSWPTLWRHAYIHLEMWRMRGDTSWTRETDYFGEDDSLLPRPTIAEVRSSLARWLREVGAPAPREWLRAGRLVKETTVAFQLARALGRGRALGVAVLGHHLGSSMEPYSMLKAALEVGRDVQIKARFGGQKHPGPGMLCREFGLCDALPEIEHWFRRYDCVFVGHYPWLPDQWDQALDGLSAAISISGIQASTDLLICGGPAWACAMMRTLWSVPMIAYFAWPIVPLIPPGFKGQVFAQVRALGQLSEPPVVFVAANWVLAAQFALQVRLPVSVQRPHGIYVNQTYSPVRTSRGLDRVMVTRIGQWATGASGVALFELMHSYIEQGRKSRSPLSFEFVFLSVRVRGADSNKPVSYSDLSNFHAAVFWPWDAMMLMFDELYTVTMPLLLPESRWMNQLMLHSVGHTVVNWWHLREALNGKLPDPSGVPFPLPFEPWISASVPALPATAYWYELTDFAQFPHLTYFSSVPDLLQRIRELDIPSLRAGMASFNRATLRSSLAFYRGAAAELLRDLGPVGAQ